VYTKDLLKRFDKDWNIHSVVEAAKFGDWLTIWNQVWISTDERDLPWWANFSGWANLPLQWNKHIEYHYHLNRMRTSTGSQFLSKGQFSSVMPIYPSLLTPNRGHQQTWRVKISDRSASQENKKRNSGSGKTHPSDGILNMHEVCSCSSILEVCKTTSKTISKTISTRPQWDCLLLRCIRN